MNLNMDYLEKLSDDEDVKFQVDQAISEVSFSFLRYNWLAFVQWKF